MKDILRSLVESSLTSTVEPTATKSQPADRDEFHDKLVLTKLTENEDVEAYLTTFERMLTVYGVREDRWAIYQACTTAHWPQLGSVSGLEQHSRS